MNRNFVARIIFWFTFFPRLHLQDHDPLSHRLDILMGNIQHELQTLNDQNSSDPGVNDNAPVPTIPSRTGESDPTNEITPALDNFDHPEKTCKDFDNQSFQQLKNEFLSSTFDSQKFKEKNNPKPKLGEHFFFSESEETEMKKKIASSGDRSSADLMKDNSNLQTVLGEQTFNALQTHNRLRSLHNLWFLSTLPRAQAEMYLELVRPTHYLCYLQNLHTIYNIYTLTTHYLHTNYTLFIYTLSSHYLNNIYTSIYYLNTIDYLHTIYTLPR